MLTVPLIYKSQNKINICRLFLKILSVSISEIIIIIIIIIKKQQFLYMPWRRLGGEEV
jgi:hypothetical protein